MLTMVTIDVQYGAKIEEISVTTRLDILNPYMPHQEGDQRVANFNQLQAMVSDFVKRKILTFVPERSTEQEHCVTVKGVDGYLKITVMPKLEIKSDPNYSAKVNYSCPNGEYLLEDVLRTACRSNAILIPEVLNATSPKELPINIPLPQQKPNSWFPGFSNYTLAAVGVAVLAVGYELTKNYFAAPKNNSM